MSDEVVPPSPTTAAPGGEPARRPSRWWIAGVPVAVALMLGASAYRVDTFWFQNDLHRQTAVAEPGDWAEVTWEYEDAVGATQRTFAVRFAGWGDTARDITGRSIDDVVLPDGTTARQVRLEFRAAPDQVMSGCVVELVDATGRRFETGAPGTYVGSRNPCVPEESPGPSAPLLEGERRGVLPPDTSPRPEIWTATPWVATPEDARIVEVRVSYGSPDYLALRTPD